MGQKKTTRNRVGPIVDALKQLDRAGYRRTNEVKARLGNGELRAFQAWRKHRGLTTSQAIRVLIARVIAAEGKQINLRKNDQYTDKQPSKRDALVTLYQGP